MEKLTKVHIEQMAKEVMDFLIENDLSIDVSIYYNGKKMKNDYTWKNGEYEHNIIVQDGFNPHDYFEWAAHNHILSMSFEGALYDAINYSGYKMNEFEVIFNKYGLYYELGNAWNLTAYPIYNELEVEYTVYEEPKEKICLISHSNAPYDLQIIMDKWYWWSMMHGDAGSCVLGAGFNFDWNGDEYFMPAQSPYQGSISWESCKDDVKKLLEEIGATNIEYDWGNMD
jgi:hypothetical protein